MSGPGMTAEEAAALAAYIGIGSGGALSGSSQINAVENLAGFGGDLLGQALLGFLDGQDIATIVEGLSYEPYDGPDPLQLQRDANESMRRVATRLGIAPEVLNSVAQSVASGTPPDVALAAISNVVFRDESGAGRIDVSEADAKDFDALSSILQTYQDAVRDESRVVEVGGELVRVRPEADIRKDMAELGFVGQFNDPSLWVFQPDETLAAAATDAAQRATAQSDLASDLQGQLGSLDRDTVLGAVRGQDTAAMEQGIRDFALRDRSGGIQRQGRSEQNVGAADATDRPLGGIQRVGRSDENVGAAVGDLRPEGLYQRPDRVPSSRGTNAQLEADLQAAQRYATFAAAEEARKGVPAAAADALRQQITEAGLEQSALQNAARMRAREAVEQGSVAGDELLDQFRNFVTSSLPTQQKTGGGTGGGTPKIRLSDEMIQQAARTAAAPYLRGR